MSSRGEKDILCRIDMNAPFGDLLTASTPLNQSIVVGGGASEVLDFQITDRLGNVVDLPLGAQSVTFQLSLLS